MLTLARTADIRTPKTERETVSYRLNYGGGKTEVLTIPGKRGNRSEPIREHETAPEMVERIHSNNPETLERKEDNPTDYPEPGSAFYFTTAPEAYDGFGTKTIRPNCGENATGKTWRMVQIQNQHYSWQEGRNGSGMHPTILPAEFYKHLETYVPATKPVPVPVVTSAPESPKPATRNPFEKHDWTTAPATWKPSAVLYYLETVCGLNVQAEERTGTDFQNAQNLARAEDVFRERNQERAEATVSRVIFLNALKNGKRFGGSRSVGKTVVLSIGSGSVELICCNADARFCQTVAGSVQIHGAASVMIPETKVSEIFNKLKTDHIDVELRTCAALNEHALTIRAGKNTFRIPAQPAPERDTFQGDFPATYCHQFKAGELLSAIRLTEFATDNESSRYALGGLFFLPNRLEGFDIVATDSRRLSVQTISAEVLGTLPELERGETYHQRGLTVPCVSVNLVSDELKRNSPESVVSFAVAEIVTDRNEIQKPAKCKATWKPADTTERNKRNVQDGETWFLETFRLEYVFELPGEFSLRGIPVDGRFPRYLDVIPQTFQATYEFNRVELLNAFETVLLSTDEESRGVDVKFPTLERQPATIVATSQTFGSATIQAETLNVKTFRTENTPVTLDPKYVIDFLKRSSADTITANVIDENTAVVFTADNDRRGVYVVMPLSQDR